MTRRRVSCSAACAARRVRGALHALFGGAVGRDTVSRVWREQLGGLESRS